MKKILALILSMSIILTYSTISFAQGGTPPEMPNGDSSQGGEGGTPPEMPNREAPSGDAPSGNGNEQGGVLGAGGSSSASYTGATSFTENTSEANTTYSSENGSENALLVSGGESEITNATITKSGDSDGDNSDFYGTNAAVLVYNGATLDINGGTVTTNGSHANGVFAYGDGVINISDTTIKTSSNNSGAIMVTGGGTLNADNVTAETDGNSSAPIRSDRGGGTLTVSGGSFISNGVGSPVIYSTADITVHDAELVSNASEGAVVEGANSITLDNVTLTDTNTSLNGNSETYKNIFLYQSMSGDADQGTASFKASNSSIVTNKGDTIFVTNTKATVSLENNVIVNKDGAFLRIQAGKWGTSGSNGGDVSLELISQNVDGDIYVDDISTLDMSITDGSNYVGTINADNTASKLAITLDSTSTITLTGDSYITELNNEVEDNSNINLNGYTLYVGDEAITSTNYTGADYTDVIEADLEDVVDSKMDFIKAAALTVATVLAIIIIVAIVVKMKKK